MSALPQLSGVDPWLMEPGKLEELRAQLAADPIPAEARGRFDQPSQAAGVTVKNGVAVIDVRGVLMKSVPMWASWYGLDATATPGVAAAIREAADEPSVKRIVLRIDSPGGQVSGIEDAANAIYEARKKKPVEALVEDMAASAAYWLASQASKISVSPGSRVGSIGVYLVSVDTSRLMENAGITVRVHRSGELKGAGTRGAPITPEQLAYYDEHVEELASEFRAAISRGRGLGAEQVSQLSTGRMWRASDAKTHGLVDRIESVPAALSRIERAIQEKHMADEKQIQDAQAQAVEAERQRVSTIKASYPDDQDFALEQIEAGASVSEAAIAYVPYLQEKTKRERAELAEKAKADHAAAASAKTEAPRQTTKPVPYGEATSAPMGFIETARAYAKEHGTTMRQAMSHVSREQPELHAAFIEEAKRNPIKIKDGVPSYVNAKD